MSLTDYSKHYVRIMFTNKFKQRKNRGLIRIYHILYIWQHMYTRSYTNYALQDEVNRNFKLWNETHAKN